MSEHIKNYVRRKLAEQPRGEGEGLAAGWQRTQQRETPTVIDPLEPPLRSLQDLRHRTRLTPLEEAHALAALIETNGLTQEQVAARLAVHQSYVSRRLALLSLEGEQRTRLERGEITPTAALKQRPEKRRTQQYASPRRAPSRNVTTVAVPTALLAEIGALYAALAQAHDLAPITLTPKASGEELLTIIGLRTAELRSLFERS